MKKTATLGRALVCLISLLAGAIPATSASAEDEGTYILYHPTQDEIREQYQTLFYDLGRETVYTAAYSLEPPYAPGDITEQDRRNALNALNFCRYVAGLPADVELNPEYDQLAQAAALISAVNGGLSHAPTQPEAMPDALYEQAYAGASRSNLALGYPTLAATLLRGYMYDSDPKNIDRVGHRRWILDPDMQYTGFGAVGNASALYAIDRSRKERFVGDYVVWPAENMPNELYRQSLYGGYNYACSVTLGTSYDTPDLSRVTVDVRSELLGRSWHLDNSPDGSDGYLTVDNAYYGQPKCIIFDVGTFPENDTVTVTVGGITKDDVEAPLTYTVRFFDLGPLAGDVNDDDLINATDATRVLLAAVGKIVLDERQTAAADVNGDGAVNAADAMRILLHAVGKRSVMD